jgi:hypothetical protein
MNNIKSYPKMFKATIAIAEKERPSIPGKMDKK